ncbi:MAG: phosphodiester glycosidase family protein [Steroidobacteraceae bacterium]
MTPIGRTTLHVAALSLLLAGTCARTVECAGDSMAGIEVTVCRVQLPHDDLRLLLYDGGGKAYANFASLRGALAARGESLVFAMNAGMYQEDLSPLGLYIAEGRQLRQLNRRTGRGNFYQLPNGVFLVNAAGARVLTTADYVAEARDARLATQSGPMLVHRGAIVENAVVHPGALSRRLRNGVCAPSPDVAAFVISEGPVTFHEFATYFRDRLRCAEALYLDGSISSLYSRALGRSDRRRDLGPIIAVVEPTD